MENEKTKLASARVTVEGWEERRLGVGNSRFWPIPSRPVVNPWVYAAAAAAATRRNQRSRETWPKTIVCRRRVSHTTRRQVDLRFFFNFREPKKKKTGILRAEREADRREYDGKAAVFQNVKISFTLTSANRSLDFAGWRFVSAYFDPESHTQSLSFFSTKRVRPHTRALCVSVCVGVEDWIQRKPRFYRKTVGLCRRNEGYFPFSFRRSVRMTFICYFSHFVHRPSSVCARLRREWRSLFPRNSLAQRGFIVSP